MSGNFSETNFFLDNIIFSDDAEHYKLLTDGVDTSDNKLTNQALESPAKCKDFAQKLFRANLHVQYQYGMTSFVGAYLNENDVIRIETPDPRFSGNYRVRGKSISFSPTAFKIGININKKPPTLAEYIVRQDN